MKRKKLFVSMIALVLMAVVPVFSLAASYGAANVTDGQTYTLEQMLTYAIQDEYMAQAEYTAILNAYKTNAPFRNILRAETAHISFLADLFDTYGFTLPENTAADQVTVPSSLNDAYEAGVQAETANIAMYTAFLSQNDLPEDVRSTFTALKNASANHLNAYTRNEGKTGNTQAAQAGRWGNGNGRATYGMMNAQCPMAQQSIVNGQCPMYSQNRGQGRMGGRGMMNNANCTGACGVLPQD